MSKVITLAMPSRAATRSAAIMPPAGPDITVWIGDVAAADDSMAPPLDFMIVHERVIP